MDNEPPFLGQNCTTPDARRLIVARLFWAVIQSTLFRWSPRPCHHWRAWLLKCFGASIPQPDKVVIFPTAKVVYPNRLHLAPRSMVGPEVVLYNLAEIRLEYGANLSQRCYLCAGTHDFNRWAMPLQASPITIGANAWITADVFVGPGVSIGELCVIGARSVVMKDQPAHMICAGNPCRPLHARKEPIHT